MRVAGGNVRGNRNDTRGDTEVAAKDACVLGLVSLKREYSQLFVLFCIIASRIRDYTGDVYSRVSIVDWLEGSLVRRGSRDRGPSLRDWMGLVARRFLLGVGLAALSAAGLPAFAVEATLVADAHVNSARPAVNSGAISNL